MSGFPPPAAKPKPTPPPAPGVPPGAGAAPAAGAPLTGVAAIQAKLDARFIGKPTTWAGDKAGWKMWKTKMLGYTGAFDPRLRDMMKEVPKFDTPIDYVALGFGVEHVYLDSVLYYLLTNFTEGEASEDVVNGEEGQGLELWRKWARYHEPKTKRTMKNKLIRIIQPKNLTGQYSARLKQWEAIVKEYETAKKVKVDDDTKQAVLAWTIAPQSVHEHLRLNSDRYTTYQQLKDYLEEYMADNEIEDDDRKEVGNVEDATEVGGVDAYRNTPWNWYPGNWNDTYRNDGWKGKGKHGWYNDGWKEKKDMAIMEVRKEIKEKERVNTEERD